MAANGKQKFRVIIVGGSIAGLTLAHCLIKSDIEFVVLEARGDIAPQEGASIGILPNGSRILDQLGMLDDCIELTAPLKHSFIWSESGALIFEDDSFETIERRHGYPVIFLDRQALLHTLFKHLGPHQNQIHVNKQAVCVDHHPTHVSVHCADGSIYEGDLVVGADGVHSRIRQELWRYLETHSLQDEVAQDRSTMIKEYSCVFGISATPPGIEVGHGHRTMAQDYAFVIMSGRKGRLYWFLFAKMDKHYTGSQRVRFTAEDMDAHAARYLDKPAAGKVPFSAIYERAEHKSYLPLEEACFKYWSKGRFVCIGDSVHKMTPNMGQGSNSAMESAACLANHLTRFMKSCDGKISLRQLEDCLQEWQTLRWPRAADMVAASAHLTRVDTIKTWKHKLAAVFLLPLMKDFTVEIATMALVGAEKLDSVPVIPRGDGGAIPFVPNFDRIRLEPMWKYILLGIAPLVGCYSLSRLTIDPITETLRPMLRHILGQGTWTAGNGEIVHLRAPLYHIPFLDRIINPLVSCLLPAISGSDPDTHAQGLAFLMDMGSMYGIWLLESNRQAQSYIDVIITTILAISAQLEGFARIAPWYYLYASIRTPLSRLLLGNNRRIDPSTSLTLLLAMILGYYCPIIISFCASGITSRRSYNALWQLFPIIVPLLHAFLQPPAKYQLSTSTDHPANPTKKQKATHLPSLRLIYLSLALISTLTATYARMTLLSSHPLSYLLLSTPVAFSSPFLSPSPTSTLTTPFQTIATHLLQSNHILSQTTSLVWLILRFRELKTLGAPVCWWKVLGALLLSTIALGPGVTFALGWGFREEMVEDIVGGF
ncbi:FAD-dependent oxidoreductase [Aspergillus ibericus CBS 121593]|uniref:FAD/NAD(P)-binding domain-containing protein n=1 Tax=Aspergillus ibericus CBS 121593 TaxID=1448316 RepID=A0A395GTU5_9EURO|nr:FAD/NAD(P)-binding domain-containing protein [Aspergillus ibericus CBS 121593]RAK98849.1 FAD/NAD(P)-binding domain-containing protein [Aspergillus ibericus CBS 121593]